jgi:hypothetical protein
VRWAQRRRFELEICMTDVRKILKTRSFLCAGVVAVMLGGALWTAPAAHARASFDGNWSVLIVTDSGTCDRAYRYALQIVKGSITYPDQTFDVSGRVDAHGHVHIRVGAGDQYASATGRLAGGTGEGRWSGRSSASQCSGHWEAERR